MKFTKITECTPCDCITGASENTIDLFVRKVRKSPDLKDADFRSHFEKEKVPVSESDCEEVCGMYGISIEIWNKLSAVLLMEKYIYTASISPKSKNNLSIIQFKTNNGLIKHTPNQKIYNEHHYDFYKEDEFTVKDLQLIEMISLTS